MHSEAFTNALIGIYMIHVAASERTAHQLAVPRMRSLPRVCAFIHFGFHTITSERGTFTIIYILKMKPV